MDIPKNNKPSVLLFSGLALLEIIFFVKLLFSNIEDWGSITDWISAISSISTLLFAFFVYSRWYKERYRDDAYQIQKQIITSQYLNLFNIIEELDFKLKNYSFRVNGHNHCLKDSAIEEFQAHLINSITQLQITSQQISNNIQVMKLFNYKPSDEFDIVNKNIIQNVDHIIQQSKTIESNLSGLKSDTIEIMRAKFYDNFQFNISNSEKYFRKVHSGKSYIYNEGKSLHELFVSI
ncbi:hypothetical protein GQM33_15520 [Escherichia coli]|uniref:hypothetical protein n=1 Tax=Escherichia coli TaxID=562 RepID=UPI001302C612|nr:hypothetical protein [Escherichia coli]KAE9653651.1 hypothetical protein GP725_15520 [Escherichia coli]MWK71057.1 hypothetical protein [Escherichia coli]